MTCLPSSDSAEPFPFTMTQPSSPAFKTILFVPHYNLSAHTFAVHTLPLHQISSVIDLLASDLAATHDLLVLDQINQTIVNLKQQLDEQHQLAVRHFSILLSHQSASRVPQLIHNVKQPDCWHCQIWCWWHTPYAMRQSQPIVIHGSSSESDSSSSSSSIQEQYWQMPSYPCWSPTVPCTGYNWLSGGYCYNFLFPFLLSIFTLITHPLLCITAAMHVLVVDCISLIH